MAIEIKDPCLTGTIGGTVQCETLPSLTYTVYPCQIDSSDELPIAVDGQTPLIAEVNNRLRESIIAIESELGVQPSGTYTTVRARLDALDIIACSLQIQINEGIGGAITIQEDGVDVITAAREINFTGPGVSVSKITDNKVDVTITGSGSTIVQVQETIPVTFNGQTAFVISMSPFDDSAVEMFVDGVKQEFGTDYSVTGTAVTYLGAPALTTSSVVEFWYLATGTSGILVEQESFTAIAAQVLFTLSQSPDDDTAVKMYLNGIKQEYGSDYTVSGTTVTYNNNPVLINGDIAEFWYIYDGTGSGSQTLAQTLLLGNTTGSTNIEFTSSADIDITSAGNDVFDISFTGSSGGTDGSDIQLTGQTSAADGGSIVIVPGAGATAGQFIIRDTSNSLDLLVFDEDGTYDFSVFGDGYFSNDLTVDGKLTVNGLIDPTGLVLTEQVSSPTPGTATTGLIWVRTDNRLIFTDQTNTDIPLGGGSAGFDIDATGTTVGSALTTIHTYVMPINKSVMVDLLVSGREQAGAKAAGYSIKGLFLENGGATQIGNSNVVCNFESDTGYDVELNAVGANVLIQVRGVVAETIDWHVRGSALENS